LEWSEFAIIARIMQKSSSDALRVRQYHFGIGISCAQNVGLPFFPMP
jgi:hypothetical protein